MYIGFRVKYPLFLSDINEIEFSLRIFEKSSNIKFHENVSSGSRVVPCGRKDSWTGGQTDMTKLIFAFCKIANTPKSEADVAVIFRTCIQRVQGSNSGRFTFSPDQTV